MCKEHDECEHKDLHPWVEFVYSNPLVIKLTLAGGGVAALVHVCAHPILHALGIPCM